MNATPLQALLVSNNPYLLVSLSKVFDLLGYTVLQASDPRQAAAAAVAQHPDLMILDATLLSHGGRELCRSVCGGGLQKHVYTLLLIEQSAPLAALVEALKLGVDDFLAQPIVFGELLARLRAAARGLEYERRMQTYLGTDPLVGLPNANAFRQALRAGLEEPGGASQLSIVAVDLDFFSRLSYTYGRPAADDALRTIAKLLDRECHATEVAAAAGNDRFWVLLPDRSETDAREWADRLRETLAATPLTFGPITETATASFGVATASAGTHTAVEAIAQAEEALEAAKRSGRNCVVLRSSLDDEANAWTNLGAPGKLFDRTIARDVMAPCTAWLRPDDSVSEAAALLRGTGQTALVVVDAEGNLVGLLTADELEAYASRQTSSVGHPEVNVNRVADVMITNAQGFAEETTFAELVKYFGQFERSLAVVLADGKPTGIVTRLGLAALSEPLCVESFAPTGDDDETSESLVVPDACTRR